MPNLVNKELCTGCTACVHICPVECLDMRADQYGFAHPFVSDADRCISCGLCERICPVRGALSLEIGKEPDAYAAYSLDYELRMDSSSGGIFSELAQEVIRKGGIVFGAGWDESFHVVHKSVERDEELSSLRGAKYSESRLGDTFLNIRKELDKGREVLFVGTPCQIAGLKAFLRGKDSNLLCVDFVCHGVPSPMAWEQYLRYRSRKDADGQLPESVNLRDKKSGWSRYQYSNVFRYPDGREYREISTMSAYMKLFTGNYILRTSCGNCSFKGYVRHSDITLGDFWGIWDIDPQMDDNNGTSAILIHTDKGAAYWDRIKTRVCTKQVSLDSFSHENPSVLYSSKQRNERTEILETIRKEGFEAGVLFLERKPSRRSLGRVIERVKKLIR